MSFIDIQYPIFLLLITIIFYLIKDKHRWVLLLAASYYFYSCWNPKYLILIIISTLIDYIAAINIEKSSKQNTKKLFLVLSLFTNLGLLFTFKYFNFFATNTNSLLSSWNILYTFPELKLLLPVGISFYTFQTIGYTIDVYRSNIKAERHLGIFAVYVSFFPQLVAGPIETARNLIPQLKQKFNFNETMFSQGLREILWGLFKKIVIADYLAFLVDPVFSNPERHPDIMLIIATYFFAIQIYCDFSAYSNIAIGSAKLLGINLMKNFKRPYFSCSIREFWQRWHISLMSWFKNYVYQPLKEHNKVLAVVIVFLISGIWHGAAWTFVIWGLYHALIYCFFWLCSKIIKTNNLIDKIFKPFKIFLVFNLVSFSWIFFRANSISDALLIIQRITSLPLNTLFMQIQQITSPYTALNLRGDFNINLGFYLILLLFILEALETKSSWFFSKKIVARLIRYISYSIALIAILLFYKFSTLNFIYFQF